jgi:hypothetical protein
MTNFDGHAAIIALKIERPQAQVEGAVTPEWRGLLPQVFKYLSAWPAFFFFVDSVEAKKHIFSRDCREVSPKPDTR